MKTNVVRITDTKCSKLASICYNMISRNIRPRYSKLPMSEQKRVAASSKNYDIIMAFSITINLIISLEVTIAESCLSLVILSSMHARVRLAKKRSYNGLGQNILVGIYSTLLRRGKQFSNIFQYPNVLIFVFGHVRLSD